MCVMLATLASPPPASAIFLCGNLLFSAMTIDSPFHDERRVAALRALDMLDTAHDARFERLTRLACALFKVPIALVSLVDHDRQWFKSHPGLDTDQTPRSIAFCSHAVELDEMLVVPDASADARFADNPLVTGEPHIRFYAGQPVHSADGYAVGTLCVIDRVAREFDPAQRQHLRDLAQLVEDELNKGAILRAREAAEQTLVQLNIELERRVEERTELLDAILDTVDIGVMACAADGSITMFNRAARHFHGLPPDTNAPDAWPQYCALFEADGITALRGDQLPLARALRGEEVKDAALVLRANGGTARVLLACGRLLNSSAGEPLGAVVALNDVTALAESRAALAQNEERLRTITDNLPVLISYIGRDLKYGFANARYQDWYGIAPAQMLGRSVREIFNDDFCEARVAHLRRCFEGHTVQLDLPVSSGDLARTLNSVFIPHLRDGQVVGAYVLTSDVTAARAQEQQLKTLALTDALTGLANRRSYELLFEAAIKRAHRSDQRLALMYLDIDNFKQINDTLGHAAGDDVLKEFARRLVACVRRTDAVCRLAGDEFTVVLEGVHTLDQCETICHTILEAIRVPFALGSVAWPVTTSIGLAWSAGGELGARRLADSADAALYQAKGAGRNRFAVQAQLE